MEKNRILRIHRRGDLEAVSEAIKAQIEFDRFLLDLPPRLVVDVLLQGGAVGKFRFENNLP